MSHLGLRGFTARRSPSIFSGETLRDYKSDKHFITMGILTWIIFGLIAGIIAKALMPGKDPGGCLITSLIGIVGAAVGGWLGTYLGWGKADSFDLGSLGVAIVGSIVLLGVYRLFTKDKK
mgnify:CR=1 FL=1